MNMRSMSIAIFSEAAARRARVAASAFLVTGCFLLPGTPFAAAQSTTASIVGTVTDNTGASIANANVTLTDLGTRQTRTTVTTSAGDYDFSQLSPGSYAITVAENGFQTLSYPNITIAAGDRAREDAKLSIGAASQTVEVDTTTPALQTDSSVIQHTVTEQAVQDLPLSGRNYINLAQITPGASEGPGNGLTSGARPDDRRQTSAVVANGQSEILNNETIDGLDNNERIIGGIGVRPSIDAIREISIQTNSYTAEVGRTGGAVINIITKSGSNAFHGSAYEFFQNDILNAFPTTSASTYRSPSFGKISSVPPSAAPSSRIRSSSLATTKVCARSRGRIHRLTRPLPTRSTTPCTAATRPPSRHSPAAQSIPQA